MGITSLAGPASRWRRRRRGAGGARRGPRRAVLRRPLRRRPGWGRCTTATTSTRDAVSFSHRSVRRRSTVRAPSRRRPASWRFARRRRARPGRGGHGRQTRDRSTGRRTPPTRVPSGSRRAPTPAAPRQRLTMKLRRRSWLTSAVLPRAERRGDQQPVTRATGADRRPARRRTSAAIRRRARRARAPSRQNAGGAGKDRGGRDRDRNDLRDGCTPAPTRTERDPIRES